MKKLFSLLVVGLIALQLTAANYCSASAWGYGASATGGGSASPTLVSDVNGLKAISKAQNKVFIITKSITVTSMVTLQDMKNVTILALPGVKLVSNQQTATSSGILFIKRTDNIIIRNLTFEGPGAYDCDGNDNLCFENVTKAWVDHCDFQDGCDGNFDNKANTDNVTVSWCRFRYLKAPKSGGSGGADDHRFTNLLGSSSSDKPSDGTYNFTWAYCWWDDGCKERMVRCRNAELHFLNCYWNSSVANYYVGPENAKAYFEGCTFAGKANTTKLIFKSYGGTNACKFVNCSGNTPSNSGTVNAPTYSYDQMSASAAKLMVTNSSCGAGATLIVTNAGKVSSSCDGGGTPVTYYTVTWNANGGSCSVSTSQVASGDAIGTLPTATKSGYTFNGWFTQASGGTQISASTTVSGNVTYYAHYTEEQGGGSSSDITWDFSTSDFTSLDSTSISNNGAVVNGLTIGKLVAYDKNNKTIDGHSFTYRMKTGGTGSATDRSFKFNVTGPCTIEVFLISSSTKTGNERTLNIFAGSYGGTPITTMEAGLSAAKQTYDYTGSATTIYLGSASGGINIYAINIIYSGSGGGDTPPAVNYILSYDENGGEGTMSDQEQTGSSLTIATNQFTAPIGYSFKEWNSNYKGSGTKYTAGQSITLTEDLTIYAVWQPNTYTITLNKANGTGGSSSVTATFDDAMPNITLPTRSGYTFKGYFSEQNGAGKQYYDANGSSTNSWTTASAATLYAYWEETSSTPIETGDLHFWFFYEADATTNNVSNDANMFASMAASGSQMAGSITVDGVSYSITRRTGDIATFGAFTIPEGKVGIFYALAVSSGGSSRQINLVNGNNKIELEVPGGSSVYQRLESDELPAGTYSIQREGSSNVRMGVIIVKLIDSGTTPAPVNYTVTWNAAANGGTCETETSAVEQNTAVGTLPEATRDGYTFDGWFTQAIGGEQITAETVISDNITFYAQFTENQSGGGETSECDEWGYGTTVTSVPTAGNSVTSGDLVIKNIGSDIYTGTLFNNSGSLSVVKANGSGKYVTGNLGGRLIESITFSVSTSANDDPTKTAYVIVFSSAAEFSTNSIIKVDDANGYLRYAPLYSANRENVTITAPSGTKSFALGRNISGASITGAGSSGSRYFYYIQACPATSTPPATYTITWNNYNGEELNTQTSTVEEGSIPEYPGTVDPWHFNNEQYTYSFAGWEPEVVAATSDAVYTAKYDSVLNKYDVLFWNWNGALLDEREWEYGTTPSYSPTPTREDDHQYTYTFSGWEPAIVPVTEPAYYEAQFTSQLRKFSAEHVVASNNTSMGSVSISPQKTEYEYGEQITISATAAQGYEFGSWQNLDGAEISTDVTTTITVTDSTVIAIFVPSTHIPYLVKHWQQNLVGNGYTEVVADRQEKEGTAGGYTSVTPNVYEGFEYPNIESQLIALDGSTVVDIYYDRLVYDIKWMIENEVVRTDHLRYGAMPSYGSTPTKQGDAQYSYTFTSWDPEVVIVTYYATYQAIFERSTNQYTVTFHANGHGTDPDSQTKEYGQTIFSPTIYAEGWTFGGWYREPACQNVWNFSTAITENIDLYAKWTANTNTPYEVYYWKQNIKDDGYSILEYDWSKSGTTGQLTAAEARTYTGFTMLPFSQLPIAADGSTKINIYYDRIIYEIQFVADGVVVETDSLRYEDIPEYHGATPTKPDDEQYTYEFKGWSPHFMAVTQDATYTAWFLEWTKEPTSLNEVETDSHTHKLIYDGRLTIIRNGKQYNAQGQLIR